ncbi:hypothetical protein BpHYR1_028258 [Brachionus plicatilis]|uniref:Uncharacterized protein n=1 Tax=Brachionus plicatilis TaxID=10195 RepID=A0A3M7P3Z8_BRAPC|nr:hypothetical protein BpHYR1_028258 [Brachionus plicatilis]
MYLNKINPFLLTFNYEKYARKSCILMSTANAPNKDRESDFDFRTNHDFLPTNQPIKPVSNSEFSRNFKEKLKRKKLLLVSIIIFILVALIAICSAILDYILSKSSQKKNFIRLLFHFGTILNSKIIYHDLKKKSILIRGFRE